MIEALLAVSQETLRGPLVGPAGFLVAFAVGTVAFFSPCILPLIPGYIAFVSGLTGESGLVGRESKRRTILGVLLFVFGFALMFSLLGAGASWIGGLLNANLRLVTLVAGIIVVAMGIVFLIPGLVPMLERERRPLMGRVKPGLVGAPFLGIAFAVGWTPCLGPGLGVMFALGLASGTAWHGAWLMFFFSLGFGFWLLLAALGMRKAIGASGWLRRNAGRVQAVGGVFMLAIGVLLITDRWDALMTPFQTWMNRVFPAPL